MMDADTRLRIMRSIKSKNTRPELAVRSMLHREGFRFRLHAEDLPGSPDIVFRSRKKVVFVHGCLWHGHDCALGRRRPTSKGEYWLQKIKRNQARDVTNMEALYALGWSAQVVWECELKDTAKLLNRLKVFLGEGR